MTTATAPVKAAGLPRTGRALRPSVGRFPPIAESSPTAPARLRLLPVVPGSVRLYRTGYELAKRLFDVAVCLVVLIPALPVMALCAALIWLEDPGRVLLAQLRTGRAGRRFGMFKFRTMVKNAEELKAELAHLNELSWPDFKITND
ncbi:MAG: sugar transferase, partial [Planctomycetes bacterium]|nr:sugar transferase [Planctomycetota bacterium]